MPSKGEARLQVDEDILLCCRRLYMLELVFKKLKDDNNKLKICIRICIYPLWSVNAQFSYQSRQA